jgi:hypothetical protein
VERARKEKARVEALLRAAEEAARAEAERIQRLQEQEKAAQNKRKQINIYR